MAKGNLTCPECGHENAVPEAGTKKITCGGCGMIMVLAKMFGEDWAEKFGGGDEKAPARPRIVSRRDRVRAEAEADEPEEEPEETGRRGRRSTRGGRGKKDEGEKKAGRRGRKGSKVEAPHHTHHYGRHGSGSQKINPMILWGGVAIFVVVAILVAVVWKQEMDKDAEREAAEKARIEKQRAAEDAKRPTINIDDLEENVDSPGPVPGEGNAAEAQPKQPKKPKKARVKEPKRYDPFTTDHIDAKVKEEIDGAIKVLKDLNATTEIRGAGDTLFRHRKESIPVLINEIRTLEYDDKEDVTRGWSLIQALKRCAEWSYKGYEFDFNTANWPEDEAEIKEGAKNREILMINWWKWWNENKDGWEPPAEDEDFFN